MAAVALPQYQFAVAKSRLAALKPLLMAIKNAEENYYLENGKYTSRIENLDIDFPNAPKKASNGIIDTHFGINLFGNQEGDKYITVVYCPNRTNNTYTSCTSAIIYYYRIWLNHSNHPYLTDCITSTDLGRKICAAEENL